MRFFDTTILLMLLSIGLAFIFPQLGAKNSVLYLDLVAKHGVAVIFFLHGSALSFDSFKSGLTNWRLHIVSQFVTFIYFPIIGVILYFGFQNQISANFRIGLFFLSIISSTIASSITMTGIAKGNVGGAVWDASLSGFIGIFFTPFALSLIMHDQSGARIDIIDAIFNISTAILLPFALGQLARPFIGDFIIRYKKRFAILDRAIIITIVFVAFCQSNLNNVWQRTTISEIILLFVITGTLLVLALLISGFIAKTFGLSNDDKIAAIFVGSTKSLANGAPIAAILFAGNENLSQILLPLLIYHQLQLIVGMALAQKWSKTS